MKKYLLFLFALGTIHAQDSAVHDQLTNGIFESYVTEAGNTIHTGDTLTIGIPSIDRGFRWISQGGQHGANFLAGKKVVVDKLKTYGNKRQGYKMYVHFKGYGLLPVLIDYEIALRTKELEDPFK
jgi:hypothetical protein